MWRPGASWFVKAAVASPVALFLAVLEVEKSPPLLPGGEGAPAHDEVSPVFRSGLRAPAGGGDHFGSGSRGVGPTEATPTKMECPTPTEVVSEATQTVVCETETKLGTTSEAVLVQANDQENRQRSEESSQKDLQGDQQQMGSARHLFSSARKRLGQLEALLVFTHRCCNRFQIVSRYQSDCWGGLRHQHCPALPQDQEAKIQQQIGQGPKYWNEILGSGQYLCAGSRRPGPVAAPQQQVQTQSKGEACGKVEKLERKARSQRHSRQHYRCGHRRSDQAHPFDVLRPIPTRRCFEAATHEMVDGRPLQGV